MVSIGYLLPSVRTVRIDFGKQDNVFQTVKHLYIVITPYTQGPFKAVKWKTKAQGRQFQFHYTLMFKNIRHTGHLNRDVQPWDPLG